MSIPHVTATCLNETVGQDCIQDCLDQRDAGAIYETYPRRPGEKKTDGVPPRVCACR